MFVHQILAKDLYSLYLCYWKLSKEDTEIDTISIDILQI